MHPVYRVLGDRDSDLCQGDIIDAELLKPALMGHQDYMAQRPDFRAFCVMTQTCDLVREQDPAEYITLAVIRLVTNVFEKGSNPKTQLQRIVGYQQNKRHYFYLPDEPAAGIAAPSVVDLRVTFALHLNHYPQIVAARRIGMNELFAANLGWMTGYVFSRIAMPEWDENAMGERDSYINRLVLSIKEDGVLDRRTLETTLDETATQRVLRSLEGVMLSLEDIHRKLDDLQRKSE